MASLEYLDTKLWNLQLAAPGNMNGLAFEMSYNESLGFKKGDPSDFKVSTPYGSWPDDMSAKKFVYPSPLQAAFKETLLEGSKDKSVCFIDVLTLNPSHVFFTDPGTKLGQEKDKAISLSHAIADVVNATDPEKTPVIRFLCGTDETRDPQKAWEGEPGFDSRRAKFEYMFWPNGEPLIQHKNAILHVGYYSPSFAAKDETAQDGIDKDAAKWVDKIIDTVLSVLQKNEGIMKMAPVDFAKKIKELPLKPMARDLLKDNIPAISWNHAKILAVNGKTVMTGGGNCWDDYLGEASKIMDHQAKVKGDAAISAHKFADYFWKYLNKPHKTDNNSFKKSILLCSPTPSEWSATAPVPEKTSFKPAYSTKYIPVLTVNKCGDWFGDMNELDYPVQIIDCVRDIALDALWQMTAGMPPAQQGSSLYLTHGALMDDSPALAFTGFWKDLKINPLAWASRYARKVAIWSAHSSVHMSQQMLVDYLQNRVDKYQKLVVAPVNEFISKTEGSVPWNGFIWPYELLIAFAWALNNIKISSGTLDGGKISEAALKEIKDSKSGGIFIVTSSNASGDGWQDESSISELKKRLKIIMRGMAISNVAFLAGFKIKEEEVSDLVDQRVIMKRVLGNTTEHYNHCKVVAVDRKLLYVGSDNAYPCYNEEHGIWVEDKPTVDAWFNDYWQGLWDRSTIATD